MPEKAKRDENSEVFFRECRRDVIGDSEDSGI
jgi:hypothetical protein